MRASLSVAGGCAVLAVAAQSSAQSQPEVRTAVSDEVVEVGQSFSLQFSVLSDSDDPSPARPRLASPAGATVQGPSVSTQTKVSIINGRMDRRQGFTATWTVTPLRVGTLRVGPPTAMVGNKTISGLSKTVRVVQPGQAPRQQAPDPFDFFRRRRGSLFPPGVFDDPLDIDPDPNDTIVAPPQEYVVETAPDPVAFLRSRVQPKTAVVGEQVTLTIYAYGNRGRFDEYPFTEPHTADFVTIPIIEDGDQQRFYPVQIGDDVWIATKVRELALFPVRTGELTLGEMKMGFRGRGYSNQQLGLPRTSELLQVRVQEPPLDGRPPGYRIGDVGRYSLSAEVTPRKIDQGGAVAVNVTLSGIGNLPTKLEVPQMKGIEWLEPRVTGDLKTEDGKVTGTRHFSYVVRLHESGQVELGELSLPHYDPKARAYRPAKAKLGVVQVVPGAGAPARAPKDEVASLLSNQLQLRTKLGSAADTPWRWTDTNWFWALLGLAPMSVLGLAASVRLGRRLSERRKTKKQSAATLASRALSDAERALAEGDAARAASDMERALFAAVEASTGVKGRGVLRERLAAELTEHGLSAGTAERVTELLAQAEAARFTGAENSGFGAKQLHAAAQLVHELARQNKSRRASPRNSASDPGGSA